MSEDYPISVQTIEIPGAVSYEWRCHDARQLIIMQLAMLRMNEGVMDDGVEVVVERDIEGTGLVGVTTSAMHEATIKVPTDDGGCTDYGFDGSNNLLTSQTYNARGEHAGSTIRYRDDALGDSMLSNLYQLLFEINNS